MKFLISSSCVRNASNGRKSDPSVLDTNLDLLKSKLVKFEMNGDDKKIRISETTISDNEYKTKHKKQKNSSNWKKREDIKYPSPAPSKKLRPIQTNNLFPWKEKINSTKNLSSLMEKLKAQDQKLEAKNEVRESEPPDNPAPKRVYTKISEGLEFTVRVFRDLEHLYPFLRLRPPPAPDSKVSKAFWVSFSGQTQDKADLLEAWHLATWQTRGEDHLLARLQATLPSLSYSELASLTYNLSSLRHKPEQLSSLAAQLDLQLANKMQELLSPLASPQEQNPSVEEIDQSLQVTPTALANENPWYELVVPAGSLHVAALWHAGEAGEHERKAQLVPPLHPADKAPGLANTTTTGVQPGPGRDTQVGVHYPVIYTLPSHRSYPTASHPGHRSVDSGGAIGAKLTSGTDNSAFIDQTFIV